jgi:hypothetical protein
LALGVKWGSEGKPPTEPGADEVTEDAALAKFPRSELSAVLPIAAPAVAPRKVRRVARCWKS